MNSDENKDSTGSAENATEKLPPIGEPVWVQCGTFRTLAYRDEKGIWRTVATKQEVKVTKVLG